jgi:hypothetical protein
MLVGNKCFEFCLRNLALLGCRGLPKDYFVGVNAVVTKLSFSGELQDGRSLFISRFLDIKLVQV